MSSKTIGGDRLGAGKKQKVELKNFGRSTHDLSATWRSSMSAGTLVPFLTKVGLPGDSFDIDLNAEVMTLPTIGPLFGSYKVQIDVFEIPMRLYLRDLRLNKLGVGLKMSEVKLPKLTVKANNHPNYVQTFDDNEHVNPSSLLKYLGISGLGKIKGGVNPAEREFNAIPMLAYWDIYKNYYANKQEERGFFINSVGEDLKVTSIDVTTSGITTSYSGLDIDEIVNSTTIIQLHVEGTQKPDLELAKFTDNDGYDVLFTNYFSNVEFTGDKIVLSGYKFGENQTDPAIWSFYEYIKTEGVNSQISLKEFPLDNIDYMRDWLMKNGANINISDEGQLPYNAHLKSAGGNENKKYSSTFSQQGLGIKTYQSDLFNNWISTEWIDGDNGINQLTSINTEDGSFTIDALNIANKVYNMLNRIAISGGSYDDWLDAVYTHERAKSVDSPVYHGSLIKELGFQEVISTANSEESDEPLGTLAGRGRLTEKHKGGKMIIKCNEPCYIMGIVSLTPRVEYSQGNNWDINLNTLDDLHKPSLDAIGFQDLDCEQMLWSATEFGSFDKVLRKQVAGKQPAWINYMTEVNKCYGNFAEQNKEMYMTLNRRYEKDENGEITDLTTYVDPSKFNHIFAQTSLDSQNFWVQIATNITARRKMSAKVIPNL